MSESHDSLPKLVTDLPGPRSREQALLLRGLECSGISGVARGRIPTFWKCGTGCILEDLDGNKFLDLTSSFGVAGLGYSHPRIVESIATQAAAIGHTMGGIYPTEPYVRALRAVRDAVGRSPRSEVLLTNSGSEAIEAAIKIALRATGNSGVLAFWGSYHGQSLGALGMTSHRFLRAPFASMLGAAVTFLPYPDPLQPWIGDSESSLLDATLSLVRHTLLGGASGSGPFAALLVEPMQNPQGYVLPPNGFLKGLREVCSEAGVLLILDEIFTGFGRCGEWLLSDNDGIIADITCVGKIMSGGTPIAACVADRSLSSTLVSNHLVPLQGGTFFGNPVTCAAAAAAIDVLHTDALVERCRTQGRNLLDRLSAIASAHPVIKTVRGKGLAIALGVVDPNTRESSPQLTMRLCGELFRRGIVTLITGIPECSALAICPPLIISEAQLAFFLDELERALQLIEN